jgi:hypothetical protein
MKFQVVALIQDSIRRKGFYPVSDLSLIEITNVKKLYFYTVAKLKIFVRRFIYRIKNPLELVKPPLSI